MVGVDPLVFLGVVVEDGQRAVVDDVHIVLRSEGAVDHPDHLAGSGPELEDALQVAQAQEQVALIEMLRGGQRRLYIVQMQGVLCISRPQMPIDLHMVEIMTMKHKEDSETKLIKGLVLDDDSLNTIYSISIDYNKYLNDNLYLNSSAAFARYNTTDTNITFDGGSNSSFPDIHFRGLDLQLGPNYRFNKISNFTPYIGLNASSFLGFQSDTNFAVNSGTYGVGGAETFVECYGITPNLGFFKSSGFLKGYGFSIENLKLECDNDHNRSMTEGYEADFDIIQYRIDYRIFF